MIHEYVWDSKEMEAVSMRTIVHKLKKKLKNGMIVNPGYLTPTGSTTVTGNGQKSVENQSGYAVNDGRTEQNEIVGKPNESTIVFRSYANPDSVTAVIDLKAKYVNKLRTGSI